MFLWDVQVQNRFKASGEKKKKAQTFSLFHEFSFFFYVWIIMCMLLSQLLFLSGFLFFKFACNSL